MEKTEFKIKKSKMTNVNCMLFQNNCYWNKIKKDTLRWDKFKLSLLGRTSVVEINVFLRTMFLFQTIPILTSDVLLKQWQNI